MKYERMVCAAAHMIHQRRDGSTVDGAIGFVGLDRLQSRRVVQLQSRCRPCQTGITSLFCPYSNVCPPKKVLRLRNSKTHRLECGAGEQEWWLTIALWSVEPVMKVIWSNEKVISATFCS